MRLRISTLHNTVLCVFSLCTTLVFGVQDTQQTQWSDSVVKTENSGKGVLIIPMEGQMCTDIRASVYAGLVERIKETKPDLIVIELFSRDRLNDFAYLMSYPREENEFNRFSNEESNNLVDIATVFYVELSDIPQVVWVKDTVGISTMLALSWPKMYMSKGAFLRPTTQAAWFNNINAEDTRGKMRAFLTSNSKIMAEYGDRSKALTLAFIDPEVALSGTWKGRKVEWHASKLGDFVIDEGEDSMPQFTATFATEMSISEGTVESIEDILLAQNIREYHLVGEDITADIRKSVDDWRDDLEDALKYLADAQQFAKWAGVATGDQVRKELSYQLRSLRSILRIMEQSPPVVLRLSRAYSGPGITIKWLKGKIEELVKQIKRIKDGERGRGRGGGRGGSGGSGR